LKEKEREMTGSLVDQHKGGWKLSDQTVQEVKNFLEWNLLMICQLSCKINSSLRDEK
jgi:hypothetical protein